MPNAMRILLKKSELSEGDDVSAALSRFLKKEPDEYFHWGTLSLVTDARMTKEAIRKLKVPFASEEVTLSVKGTR